MRSKKQEARSKRIGEKKKTSGTPDSEVGKKAIFEGAGEFGKDFREGTKGETSESKALMALLLLLLVYLWRASYYKR